MLDKNYGNLLIDYYGSFLTKHQNNILDDYFKDDLSMNEIAINYHISKAAVSDIINRSYKILDSFEKKLKLIEQNNKIEKVVKELDKKGEKSLANKLKNIIRR